MPLSGGPISGGPISGGGSFAPAATIPSGFPPHWILLLLLPEGEGGLAYEATAVVTPGTAGWSYTAFRGNTGHTIFAHNKGHVHAEGSKGHVAFDAQ